MIRLDNLDCPLAPPEKDTDIRFREIVHCAEYLSSFWDFLGLARQVSTMLFPDCVPDILLAVNPPVARHWPVKI